MAARTPRRTLERTARAALRPFVRPVRSWIEGIVDRSLVARGIEIGSRRGPFPAGGFAVPDLTSREIDPSTPFPLFSTCAAADFFHPRYHEVCGWMADAPRLDRKQWEWVHILHELDRLGVLTPGARGLGFGVGSEPLPAVFAGRGCTITATDAPHDAAFTEAWSRTGQHSTGIDQLLLPAVVDDQTMRRLVSHQPCDMNAIDPSFTGYDFNWSSCCFEHLGSLEAGLDFVVEAVEKTLRPGGIAVHTTELNLSDSERTLESANLVLYRQRDLRMLIERLEKLGHRVEPLVIGPPTDLLDLHIDLPSYPRRPAEVRLRMLVAGYVTTSVGLTIHRRT